jgi:hypothetical protein
MIKVLFWNVGRNPRKTQIAQLALNYDVEILVLAEMVEEPGVLLEALNSDMATYSYAPGVGNTKIHIFGRLDQRFIAPIRETNRLTVRRLNPPGSIEILLAAVHFPSKLRWKEESQILECTRLANEIQDAEKKAGHQRTVLVGDFNMNPFETGVVSAGGVHAVMDRRTARRGTRVVQDREYPLFYNPMWGLFGDGTRGPAGTYHYSDSQHKVYFWNMFDQVLIRPALLGRFRLDDLEVIRHTGEQSLLTKAGLPNRSAGSDHLPILFGLSL